MAAPHRRLCGETTYRPRLSCRSMSDQQPDVILITADELHRDALSCYGNRAIETSNVDRLASESYRYENAYTVSPWCLPARAGLVNRPVPAQQRGVHELRRMGRTTRPRLPEPLPPPQGRRLQDRSRRQVPLRADSLRRAYPQRNRALQREPRVLQGTGHRRPHLAGWETHLHVVQRRLRD